MQVVHLSVECFPVAKVGGLADVVGSLPRYQCGLGVDASVVMPWFDTPFVRENEFDAVAEGSFQQGDEPLRYTVLKERSDKLGFPLYLIKIPGKLDRPEVYCYPDEAEQWLAFQHAFLKWAKYDRGAPDIIHCHDHHVGLVPFLAKHAEEFSSLKDVKTVVTIHNAQHQGWMEWGKSVLLPPFDTWKWGLPDWDGLINPLAAAIKCCDAYTTVSDGYQQELYENANGLEGLFRDQASKAHGIVNGIDTSYWNPSSDKSLRRKYSPASVSRGKKENKKALCAQYGLDEDAPLLAFIGRFALEKGADFLYKIMRNLFLQNQYKISIFTLGSGDARIEAEMQALQAEFPEKMGLYVGYNEALAHEVYAASDMLLMPSRVEPCGLNQLYALKYGTIPIVRRTGGLKDTVRDVREEDGYGFVFGRLDESDATEAVTRALDAYSKADQWKAIRARAMELDFSWDRSAQKYIDLYNQL